MDFASRIRTALTRGEHPPDPDVVEELSQHAAAMYERARADGESKGEAVARVETQIAVWQQDPALAVRRTRRSEGIVAPPSANSGWATGLLNDVRYACRLLSRQWKFAAVVTTTMAIGIGVTTALFSVTYGVLLKPLSWDDAERIVRLEETRGGHRSRFNSFSNAAYLAWRGPSSTLEAIGAWQSRTLTLTGGDEPARIRLTVASASLFDVLKPQPILGTVFTARDESEPVIVLGEGLWRERFGADPGIVGRAVQIDGRPYTVAGVLPAEAGFPTRDVHGWVPHKVFPTDGNHFQTFNAVARLRPGASAAQAADEGTAIANGLPTGADMDMAIRAIFGGAGPVRITATPLPQAIAGDVRRPLLMLLAAVLLLFVTATANVATLQLARATTRRREIAIRSALGAGRARVIRQLLVENLLLGLTGGAAGLALAFAVQRMLPTLLPPDFPRLQELAFDWVVIAFAGSASLCAGLVVGLAPAWTTGRFDLIASLSEDGLAPAGSGWRSRPAKVRSIIMAGQIAIACVLLVGASLLGRSFLALMNADRGFDPSSTLTARLQMPGFAFSVQRRAEIVDTLLERVRAFPGVTAASYSDGPVLGTFGGSALSIAGKQVQASTRTVMPGYFAAMGIPFSAGRDFSMADITSGRPMFIVNETFAREYLASQPAGHFVQTGFFRGASQAEVIGVVKDVRHGGVTEPAQPEMYLYRDSPRMSSAPTLIVRASDPLRLGPHLRTLARELDAALTLDSIMTLEDRVMTTVARPRLYAMLIGVFASCALLIAVVGLLGLLSYVVSQRSRELAVRGALGARPPDLMRIVLTQGLLIASVGTATGLVASAAASKLIASMLYGVTTRDLATYTIVAVVLLGVAFVSCLGPAARAARIEPLRVLKGD